MLGQHLVDASVVEQVPEALVVTVGIIMSIVGRIAQVHEDADEVVFGVAIPRDLKIEMFVSVKLLRY